MLRQRLKQHAPRGHPSWKKCQKLRKKATPAKRQAYLQAFQAQFAPLWREQVRIIYIDEAHCQRDLALGYPWTPVGKPGWRRSDCPRLADRLHWYGAYDFLAGQCWRWHEGACHGAQTIQVLPRLKTWLGHSELPVVIIGDNAPGQRTHPVQVAAAALGFTLMPGYTPALNPSEGLWQWRRADVTQLPCYPTLCALFEACKAFIERINREPDHRLKRLWPKFDLTPAFEKLLLSN